MSSPVFQISGFPILTIVWLEKMATMKTVYGRIKVLRVLAYLLTGIIDDGIILAKVGNAVKNFIDSSFFSTSSMKSFCFNTGLLLNSFRIALLAALFFISSTCWRSMSVWQETFTLNFVFLKDVVVVFQRNISRNAENFGDKFVYAVIASVLFSPLIRPFSRWFGLLRTVCWLNIVGTVPRAGLLIPESVFRICLVS